MNGRLSLPRALYPEVRRNFLTSPMMTPSFGFEKEHDELSSQKEQNLGELALFLPCPVLDCPGNAKNSTKQKTPQSQV
ncbi:hypothetical protein TNCV_1018101 [Trichonephila clavipes]|nr:hypothetical protein TNCV_1018101 [Trichonephila clavipes]